MLLVNKRGSKGTPLSIRLSRGLGSSLSSLFSSQLSCLFFCFCDWIISQTALSQSVMQNILNLCLTGLGRRRLFNDLGRMSYIALLFEAIDRTSYRGKGNTQISSEFLLSKRSAKVLL